MHLDPELARVLIRTMQDVRPGNQLWLATHNAQIIDEAGRDRVTYVTRDPTTRQAVVTPATRESASAVALSDLFGYSGYIGVAKNMVFLEGEVSSADRKMVFNAVSGAWQWCEASPGQDGRKPCRVSMLLSWPSLHGHLQPHRCRFSVGAALHAAAVRIAGEVLRDMVAFRLNLVYRPQDFSLGQAFAGQMFVNPDGTWREDLVARSSPRSVLELDMSPQILPAALMPTRLAHRSPSARTRLLVRSKLDRTAGEYASRGNGSSRSTPGRRDSASRSFRQFSYQGTRCLTPSHPRGTTGHCRCDCNRGHPHPSNLFADRDEDRHTRVDLRAGWLSCPSSLRCRLCRSRA